MKNLKFPVTVFVIWRTVMFLLSAIAPLLLPFKGGFPYINELLKASGLPDFLWKWGNFDGVHYLYLSQHSYSADGLHVFFPVYPILIKLVALITGNPLVSALVVSNFAFLIAIFLFYDLVKRNFGEKVARWSCLFLVSFPTSFFFGAVYTESLFFVLLLISFSYTGFIGAVSSLLAGGTRLIGSFLLPSFIFNRKLWFVGLASIIGLVMYITFLWWAYQKPLGFLTSQALFKNARASSLSTLVTPPQVVWRYFKIFTTADPAAPAFKLAAFEFSSFLFATIILLLITFNKKYPKPWIIFSWLSFVLPTLSGTFSSMPRYILLVFPIYIYLAELKSNYLKLFILSLFTVGLLFSTILFIQGYFIS